MKKIVSLIILGLMFLFSGCGTPYIYNTIPNIEKEKFSIVLEIDEDIVCKNKDEDFIFNFKKGDKFGGYSFKGKTFGGRAFPDYAIGFPIHPYGPNDIYLMLQENGTPLFEEIVFLGLLANSGENLIVMIYPDIICYKNNLPIPIKFNLRSEN